MDKEKKNKTLSLNLCHQSLVFFGFFFCAHGAPNMASALSQNAYFCDTYIKKQVETAKTYRT